MGAGSPTTAPPAPEPLRGAGAAPTTRSRKKAQTRRRIHAAAVCLAVDEGLAAVTVEEVAARARVSPRTFFNYFATKEDALVGADPGRPAQLHADVLARPAEESTVAAIRAVVTAHVRDLEADPELWRMRQELAARSPDLAARLAGAGDRIETALVDAAYARAGSDPAADLEPGITARVAMAAVRAAFHQHRIAGRDGSLADRLDAAFDVALSGPAGD